MHCDTARRGCGGGAGAGGGGVLSAVVLGGAGGGGVLSAVVLVVADVSSVVVGVCHCLRRPCYLWWVGISKQGEGRGEKGGILLLLSTLPVVGGD
jgi:hypothetical protein